VPYEVRGRIEFGGVAIFPAGVKFSIFINGEEVVYTTVTDDPDTNVLASLIAAIEAKDGVSCEAGTGADDFLVTGDPGETAFSMVAGEKTTVNDINEYEPYDEALTAIQDADPNWYGLAVLTTDKVEQELVSDWVHALMNDSSDPKFVRFRTNDEAIPNNGGGTDPDSIAAVLKAKDDPTHIRAQVIYNSFVYGDPEDEDSYPEFIDVAMTVKALSFDPMVEAATDKFKAFKGITVDDISPVQRVNILGTEEAPTSGKNANMYSEVAGYKLFQCGMTSGGEWSDIVFGADSIKVRIENDILAAFAERAKIPMTDQGIQSLGNIIRGVLKKHLDSGFLAFDEELDKTHGYQLILPLVKNISVTDRAKRIVRGIQFVCRAAGAIHAAKPIRGTIAP